MTPAHILVNGAELLKRVGKVATGMLAHDKRGRETAPHSLRSVCWCAVGVLYKVTDTNVTKPQVVPNTLAAAAAGLDLAALLLFQKGIQRVNDEHGLEDVLECYRQAWRETAAADEPC